jgi:hypothetical protein
MEVSTKPGNSFPNNFYFNTINKNNDDLQKKYDAVVSSGRIRVKIDDNYFDVISCTLATLDVWKILFDENSW